MHHISSLIIALLIPGSLAQLTDPVQLDKWAEFSLSVPRAYVAALTVNNYAVLAGGSLQNNTELTTVVDVLDLSTKNIAQTNMSLARSRILAVSVGKYAIFAGGYNQTIEGSTYVNLVEVLDVDSMQWKSTQFPEEFFSDRIGRYASNAASTNSLAVFFNGTHLAFYDPAAADAGAWNISTRIAFTPTRFVGTSLVTLGSVIYGFSMGQLFAYNMATTDLIPMQPFNILDMLTSVYAFALGTNVYFSTTERMYSK